MNKSTFAIIGLLSVSVILLAVAYNMKPVNQDVGRIVYNACEKARIDNTVRESDCAKLQYKYKYEYLCQNKAKSNATDSWTECWVESNDQLAE